MSGPCAKAEVESAVRPRTNAANFVFMCGVVRWVSEAWLSRALCPRRRAFIRNLRKCFRAAISIHPETGNGLTSMWFAPLHCIRNFRQRRLPPRPGEFQDAPVLHQFPLAAHSPATASCPSQTPSGSPPRRDPGRSDPPRPRCSPSSQNTSAAMHPTPASPASRRAAPLTPGQEAETNQTPPPPVARAAAGDGSCPAPRWWRVQWG